MTQRKLAFYLFETQKVHKKGQLGDLGRKKNVTQLVFVKKNVTDHRQIPTHWQLPQTDEDESSTQTTEFHEERRRTCL